MTLTTKEKYGINLINRSISGRPAKQHYQARVKLAMLTVTVQKMLWLGMEPATTRGDMYMSVRVSYLIQCAIHPPEIITKGLKLQITVSQLQ